MTLCDLAADLRALTPSEAAERIFPNRQSLVESLWDFQNRLVHGLRRRGIEAKQQVDRMANCRVLRRPLDALLQQAQRLDERASRLSWLIENDQQRRLQKVQAMAGQLEALSPLQVLSRGYSVTLNRDGHTVLDSTQVQRGDQLETRLHRGTLVSQVLDVLKADDDGLEMSGPEHRKPGTPDSYGG